MVLAQSSKLELERELFKLKQMHGKAGMTSNLSIPNLKIPNLKSSKNLSPEEIM